MIHLKLSLVLMVTSLVATQVPAPQASATSPRPSFAGVWAPVEPARADAYFDNGLSMVPGGGRLVIEQRPDRLTVTGEIPDDILDRLLTIQKKHRPTTIYRIVSATGRSGGAGASGVQDNSSWQGDRLVFWETTPTRSYSLAFSLDGDRLKLEMHSVVGPGKESTLALLFSRVK